MTLINLSPYQNVVVQLDHLLNIKKMEILKIDNMDCVQIFYGDKSPLNHTTLDCLSPEGAESMMSWMQAAGNSPDLVISEYTEYGYSTLGELVDHMDMKLSVDLPYLHKQGLKSAFDNLLSALYSDLDDLEDEEDEGVPDHDIEFDPASLEISPPEDDTSDEEEATARVEAIAFLDNHSTSIGLDLCNSEQYNDFLFQTLIHFIRLKTMDEVEEYAQYVFGSDWRDIVDIRIAHGDEDIAAMMEEAQNMRGDEKREILAVVEDLTVDMIRPKNC